jgi:5'-phosphate synthase pdxT subunit
MLTIGVLGLQGAVSEHLNQIKALGHKSVVVKNASQLNEIDGLIIPGGESTAIRKLMDRYGFIEPIKHFSQQKKPIFGTCAGMVLLASELSGSEAAHLQLIDLKVQRNGFGRQRDSFETKLSIQEWEMDFPGVFIRAPYAESAGSDVEILAVHEEKIVAAKQDHILVTAFHPELTDDNRFMNLFINMVQQLKEKEIQKQI